MVQRRGWIGLAALVAALALPGAAAADSLVYVKAGNVWIANADGSNAYQVTLDGTARVSPYASPSQADDGTIVAVRATATTRRQLYRMRQNGELLNPPIDTPAPGTGALDARVSPDGRLVAPTGSRPPSSSPTVCLLRERREPRAAQLLRPLHGPRRRSARPQHRRLAVVDRQRHDRPSRTAAPPSAYYRARHARRPPSGSTDFHDRQRTRRSRRCSTSRRRATARGSRSCAATTRRP